MVPYEIFYESKTANTDRNVTDIREIYGFIEVSVHFLLFLIFRSIIRINIMIGGNKNRDFQFFFNLPNNNVGGSVSQSIKQKEY